MKNIKNFTSLYPAINIILFQVIGIVVFNKDFSQRLKHLFIYRIEDISSVITVETEDDRLVTSQLTDVKLQYKVID